MSSPFNLTMWLPDLGELLAKTEKKGWAGKWPKLKEIMDAQETKNSRKVKEGLLEGMRRVFPGDNEAEREFDEIFHRGKRHPSADRLFGVGSDLGMMWLAGIRSGWPSLDEILNECHIENRQVAKNYIMEGLIAILGREEAKIAWDRIFPQISNADLIRFEGRVLGLQQKLGTLDNPDSIKIYAAVFGTTYNAAIRDLFLESMTEMFGEEEGKELYAEIIPHAIKPKIIELLRLEGHQLAISAEMFFLLCGAKIPALELVRKVRDLTRQGKVKELRTWKLRVDQGIAPSFLKGQQNLDQWLVAKDEAEEGEEEEREHGEIEEEEDEGSDNKDAGRPQAAQESAGHDENARRKEKRESDQISTPEQQVRDKRRDHRSAERESKKPIIEKMVFEVISE